MVVLNFDEKETEFKNLNLIFHNLKEIEEKKPSDCEVYRDLRFCHKQYHFVYSFYDQIKENEYLRFREITFKFNSLLIGDMYIPYSDCTFNLLDDIIVFDKFEKVSTFYRHLMFSPLPFLFIPACDLNEFNRIMKEVNLLKNKKNDKGGFMFANNNKCSVMLFEPYDLVHVDLMCMIERFISDSNTKFFLYGFIYDGSMNQCSKI